MAEQKQHNIHVGGGVSKADFVKRRQTCHATLAMPRLILPSVQVNIRAGQLPPPVDNGTIYLKVPLKQL